MLGVDPYGDLVPIGVYRLPHPLRIFKGNGAENDPIHAPIQVERNILHGANTAANFHFQRGVLHHLQNRVFLQGAVQIHHVHPGAAHPGKLLGSRQYILCHLLCGVKIASQQPHRLTVHNINGGKNNHKSLPSLIFVYNTPLVDNTAPPVGCTAPCRA